MDYKILVKEVKESGENLVHVLIENKFPVSEAFWEFDKEIEEWYLIIVTKLVEEKGALKTYSKIGSILRENKIDIRLDKIKVIKSKDKRAKVVRKILRSSPKALDNIRVSGSAFNSIYFDDLYIYKIKK